MPDRFFSHLLQLLHPTDGHLLVLNQGKQEADRQASLFKSMGLSQAVMPLGEMPASFVTYTYPRYGWHVYHQD
jgi:hypothetical protein